MSVHSTKPHYQLPAPYNAYVGAKGGEGVYQAIINQIRPHIFYCEPFAGSAAIFRRMKPSRQVTLCDLDKNLMIQHGYGLVQGKHPDYKAYIDAEANAWHGQFMVNVDFRMSNEDIGAGRVSQVHLMVDDYKEAILRAIANATSRNRAVIYLDPPPYPLTTRLSANRYKYDLTEQQHVELLDFVLAKCSPDSVDVLISINPNTLYAKKLAKWRLAEWPTQTGEEATEHLYCNYEAPTHLHDYQHLGDDYRIREKINRRLDTMMNTMAAFPTLQRHMLLEKLTQAVAAMPYVPMPEKKAKKKASRKKKVSAMAEVLGGGTFVVNKVCMICGKQKASPPRQGYTTNFKLSDMTEWQHVGPGQWVNPTWTCSIDCIEKAQAAHIAL